MRAGLALAAVAVAGGVAIAVIARWTTPAPEPTCGAGFVRAGWRCCDGPDVSADGTCARLTPPPQRWIEVPATTLVLGPSDWEAEGRVATRAITVRAFYMDAREATAGEVAGRDVPEGGDRARAASGLSLDEARRYCESRGARLPTEDEWVAAAAGERARRYPWGDTGAVCRRAAWGLADGPCDCGARGPDSAGAHPDGRSPLGLDDLAGNVAEWTTPSVPGAPPAAHGGSWRTALAADLRVWSRLAVAPGAHDDRVGVRCAKDSPPGSE